MKALRILGILMLIMILITASSCDDESGVQAPPKPVQLSLQTYTVNSGLPSDDVYDILTDSQGTTWFATELGMGMLENNTITIFDQGNGLSHPNCRAVAEFDGKIWVGTWGGGVAVYDGASWSTIDVSDGLVDASIFSIATDDTSLWFATIGGVSQYTPASDRFIRYIEEMPRHRWTAVRKGIFPDPITSSIVIGTTGGRPEVWFGAKYEGITVWRPEIDDAIYYNSANSGMPGESVNGVYYNNIDGKYWVALATAGLASVDVGASTWRTYEEVNGLPSPTVHSVTGDSSGTIWVGTNKGFAKQNGDSFIGFTTANGLPEGRVRKIYIDSQNRVWLAFINGGAARLLD